MIKIKPSPTPVSKEQLRNSSREHILDVMTGMYFFADWLINISKLHDHDKLSNIDEFYSDFQNNFKTTGWWDNHRKVNRHHLGQKDGVPNNVNLMDVIEYIVDCVMAGKARNADAYYAPKIEPDVLMKAFNNTVKLLEDNVEVEE